MRIHAVPDPDQTAITKSLIFEMKNTVPVNFIYNSFAIKHIYQERRYKSHVERLEIMFIYKYWSIFLLLDSDPQVQEPC
jgi:hypothetical protein